MNADRHLITVELQGTRYRGAYALEEGNLVVEAHGLPRKMIDASIVDHSLGEPTTKLAKLVLRELLKENMALGEDTVRLAAQGSTTQVCFL